jgi:thiosulfate/3-mercaptopyruvate sulfurtransferase
MLDYYGHSNKAILDGGFSAWKHSDGAVDAAVPEQLSGNFVPVANDTKIADFDYVKNHLGSESTAICDALSAASYAKGVIPQTRNLPMSTTFSSDGNSTKLRPAWELLQAFDRLDIEKDQELIFCCGAGYAEAQDYSVARAMGFEKVRLYTVLSRIGKRTRNLGSPRAVCNKTKLAQDIRVSKAVRRIVKHAITTSKINI